MPNKHNKKRMIGARNLVVVSALTAILLSIATYAWFVGMQTVNVTSFDVEIAATESLSLSLDGESWSPEVEVTEDNYSAYTNHTNNLDSNLIPMSSIGAVDPTASRMILYEKASLTPTHGGYRLLASRVDNYTAPTNAEPEGYVVFDLFVKNISGHQYIPEYDLLDEEAVYLTIDSRASIGPGGTPGTGIENSVRIAFAQVGRVIATSSGNSVRDIACDPDPDAPGVVKTFGGTTGICRPAAIWEPNDTKHVLNAIKWYDNSCLKRTGADLTLPASYGGSCNEVKDGTHYQTYAVGKNIASSDRVDVYDGTAYNNYAASVTSGFLIDFPYFTDSMKVKYGNQRPEFMQLAPNSITKVRVYIYIEGQDVDNYDFAQLSNKISIRFGFTKERFTPADTDYDGPTLPEYEPEPPLITLIGESEIFIEQGSTYVDAGATAYDSYDGDVTDDIVVVDNVDEETIGTYTVTYNVVDSHDHAAAEVVRTVHVVSP